MNDSNHDFVAGETDLEILPVIFRAERSGDFKGDVTAVFPTLPFSCQGTGLTVYDGCHSEGSFAWYQQRTRAATPEEYAPLLDQLRHLYGTSLGDGDPIFDLKVYRRMTRGHRAAYQAEADRIRNRGNA